MARAKKKTAEMREVTVENLTDFEVVFLILRGELYDERTMESIRDQFHCFEENRAGQSFQIPYRADMDSKSIRRVERVLSWMRNL